MNTHADAAEQRPEHHLPVVARNERKRPVASRTPIGVIVKRRVTRLRIQASTRLAARQPPASREPHRGPAHRR